MESSVAITMGLKKIEDSTQLSAKIGSQNKQYDPSLANKQTNKQTKVYLQAYVGLEGGSTRKQ